MVALCKQARDDNYTVVSVLHGDYSFSFHFLFLERSKYSLITIKTS